MLPTLSFIGHLVVRRNVPTLSSDYIFSGKGYMIDHQANPHSELERDEYLNIQSILDNYDDIKDLSDGGQLKLAFSKKIGKSYAVVVELSKEDGKILLHKSFFYRDKTGKRTPYKNYCCPLKLKMAKTSNPKPCKFGLRAYSFKK